MPNRIIKSRARDSTVQLADCLGSLFALELLWPSPRLYLISPWLSDMGLIRNRLGQFRALAPGLGLGDLGLAAVLTELAERGALVRIVYRPGEPINEDFLRKLPPSIERRTDENLHEKGLITNHFYLRGSMNFTHSGVNLNDEHIELTTEPAEVAQALLEAQQRWETL